MYTLVYYIQSTNEVLDMIKKVLNYLWDDIIPNVIKFVWIMVVITVILTVMWLPIYLLHTLLTLF